MHSGDGAGGPHLARRMWWLFEPYHDVVYFTPESRAAADALGCRGGWMGYFAMRAAPLGAAPPELVTALFYSFPPALVHRALPYAWQVATPEQYLQARLTAVDAALHRLLGAEVLDSAELAEAAGLARRAALAAPTAGRLLAAANSLLPWPEQPHLVLWHATTLLRESRGDGHVAALVAAGLGPCEALVLFAADQGMPAELMRSMRPWPEEEWRAAERRVVELGLLHPGAADGEPAVLTSDGRALRVWVEERTDEAATAPWHALGAEGTARFAELLTPVVRTLAERNDAIRVNPMGLDPRRILALRDGSAT